MQGPPRDPPDPRLRALAEFFGRRHWWREDAMLLQTQDIVRLFGSVDLLEDALRTHATRDALVQEGAEYHTVWWRFPKSGTTVTQQVSVAPATRARPAASP